MTFERKRIGNIQECTMTVNSGYKYVAKFSGGNQWCMMETERFISNIGFKLINENGNLVSFNAQSGTFRFSIKEFYFF